MGSLLAWFILLFAPADDSCLVLDAMDQLRASAHARQSTAGVTALYADREAAAPDLRLMEQYAVRDLRLIRMTMERSSCAPLDSGRVHVTERLAVSVVQLPDGTRRALPVDAWTQRTIRLVHDGWWRIAQVTTHE